MNKLPRNVIISRLAKKVKKLLQTNPVEVVIVTGSVGKTSAKIAIGKLLSTSHQVRFSEDSYNTSIGLPLSFFGLKTPTPLWDPLAWARIFQKISAISKNYPYDIVVLEMAEDELEAMMSLLEFIKPQYGVITEIAAVHMDRMVSIQKVIHDNWAIARKAKTLVYNADADGLSKLAKNSKNTFGFGQKDSKIRFLNITRLASGYLQADISIAGQKHTVKTKLVGQQNLNGLLAAASVAHLMGMDSKKIATGISKITAVNGRMNLLSGVNGSKIIDDSYNSSPGAVIAALGTLKEFKASSKIAVLGNMNELGELAKSSHLKIGAEASKIADMLIVVGKDAEIYTVAGATEAGMDPDKIKIFKTPYEIGHFLKRIVQKNDVVLVKGSQNGVFTEEVARILLDPSLKPAEVLVRQSASWKRRKHKAFGIYV